MPERESPKNRKDSFLRKLRVTQKLYDQFPNGMGEVSRDLPVEFSIDATHVINEGDFEKKLLSQSTLDLIDKQHQAQRHVAFKFSRGKILGYTAASLILLGISGAGVVYILKHHSKNQP